MEINFPEITFEGSAIVNNALLTQLPNDLRSVLEKRNGFIAFGGGLHIRGVCDDPVWHSLGSFWTGKYALSKFYPNVKKEDVPFGQDCVGDQFFLRENEVFRLQAESGEVKNMRMDLTTFLEEAEQNPLEFLQLHPLKQVQSKGGKLDPGQLINVYPPFITAQSHKGVSLKPITMIERILFLADFSKQISGLPDGSQIKIKVVPSKESL